MGTLGDPCEVIFVDGTLGVSWGGVAFSGTLEGAISFWNISINLCIMLFVASPFRNNGIRRCGCWIADDSLSMATVMRSSEDVSGMVYLVGRNSIVWETCWPPVLATATLNCR